jgi:hypothetical protein
MFSLRIGSKAIITALAAVLLFANFAAAQISGLCNTGETAKTALGCTGVLVTPNPTGGGPNRDGNWGVTFRPLSADHNPCLLPAQGFVYAWVDTPFDTWLPNSVSAASEWSSPYYGDVNGAAGWYIYKTAFRVPSVLLSGAAPTGVTIDGQFASDNAIYAIYLESPANNPGGCAPVSGQAFPVGSFEAWTTFSFTNSTALAPGADASLYFVVQNAPCDNCNHLNATGLRVEFFASSTFN